MPTSSPSCRGSIGLPWTTSGNGSRACPACRVSRFRGHRRCRSSGARFGGAWRTSKLERAEGAPDRCTPVTALQYRVTPNYFARRGRAVPPRWHVECRRRVQLAPLLSSTSWRPGAVRRRRPDRPPGPRQRACRRVHRGRDGSSRLRARSRKSLRSRRHTSTSNPIRPGCSRRCSSEHLGRPKKWSQL